MEEERLTHILAVLCQAVAQMLYDDYGYEIAFGSRPLATWNDDDTGDKIKVMYETLIRFTAELSAPPDEEAK